MRDSEEPKEPSVIASFHKFGYPLDKFGVVTIEPKNIEGAVTYKVFYYLTNTTTYKETAFLNIGAKPSDLLNTGETPAMLFYDGSKPLKIEVYNSNGEILYSNDNITPVAVNFQQ